MPQTITIKLLNERRSNSDHRKIDGRSGKLYVFRWDAAHRAYCYPTTSRDELDDIFNSQGRALGCYFAPVFHAEPKPTPTPELSPHVLLALLKTGVELPKSLEPDAVASAIVAAFDAGYATAQQQHAFAASSAPPSAPETPSLPSAEAGADAPPPSLSPEKTPASPPKGRARHTAGSE